MQESWIQDVGLRDVECTIETRRLPTEMDHRTMAGLKKFPRIRQQKREVWGTLARNASSVWHRHGRELLTARVVSEIGSWSGGVSLSCADPNFCPEIKTPKTIAGCRR